ncbi:MAG TPA: ribonuclease HII [Anaerolineales bacterium]|nr:ribonuclease HII [Anaerolineales bacterium]
MARPEPARPDLRFERALARRGVELVAGLDEAGRGALAGPIFAAAVILPLRQRRLAALLRGVRDSKTLTAAQRRRSAAVIRRWALGWAVAQATCQEIDEVGPLVATRRAMQRAVLDLQPSPQHLLIDHLRVPELAIEQTGITHGDARILSIAAASILAKVGRDELMEQLGAVYPVYGFAQHKGYGTAAHLEALRRWGPSPVHRRKFEPVSVLLTGVRQPRLLEPA